MQLHFVGTGGGRFCMINQLRRTGGFIVEHNDTRLYVDPAPGALVHSLNDDQSLKDLDGIFVSHAHLDHCGDLDVMIEAMTNGCTTERGTLIANETSLHGSDEIDPAVDTYHRNNVSTVVKAEEGENHQFTEMNMMFRETRHKNVQTTGFVLETGKNTLGYIPDTEAFDGLAPKFDDADMLIINVLRPHDKEWKGHLNLKEAVQIVETIDPEKTFFQHFGMNFLQRFREELNWLDNHAPENDITLASDGTTYSFEERGLENFV